MPLKKLHSKHCSAESKAQRYPHWMNKSKRAGTNTHQWSCLGVKKNRWCKQNSLAARIRQHAASARVPLAREPEMWPLTYPGSFGSSCAPLALRVGMSPGAVYSTKQQEDQRWQLQHHQLQCSCSATFLWSCSPATLSVLKSTMQMPLRTLYKHKNSRNKTLWTIWKIQKSAFP